jgi:hypothetical protein
MQPTGKKPGKRRGVRTCARKSAQPAQTAGPPIQPYSLKDDPEYKAMVAHTRKLRRQSRAHLESRKRQIRWATDPEFREKSRLRKHGLTPADYQAMLERQGGVCAFCRKPYPKLCVDHCHLTGKVRWLLCRKCNIGLGCFDDDPERMRVAMTLVEEFRRSGATSLPPRGEEPDIPILSNTRPS